MQGRVHGGEQPVVGGHIHLMAASTGGYGSASTSLLTLGTDGTDAYGGYVVTDGRGFFTITGDYVCTPGTQVYVLATGGNPGLPQGQTNQNLALISAIGTCPADGTFVTTVPTIYIDEVTTVASVYALSGFMTDLSHVASSGTTLSNQGMQNAFANAQNLFGMSTGAALATTPAGNGTVPQAELNTLANILAACVNSAGAASAGCTTLFSNAMNGTTAPTDTATAALNIAHNPAANVGNLFGIQTSTSPYMPALSAAPNDFTVALSFTGGGVNQPISIAIDGGNVWVDNGNSLSEFNGVTGAPLSGAAGFTGNGLDESFSLALDGSGNAWAVNQFSVSKFNQAGVAAPGSPYSGGGLNNPSNYGVLSPRDIAFDANGNAWVASYQGGGRLTKLNGTTGGLLSPAGGYTLSNSGNTQPNGVAIDSAGHVWSSGYNVPVVFENSVADGSLLFTSASNAGGLDVGIAIAIDGSNNLWLPDNYDPNTLVGDTLTELTSAGVGASNSPLSGGGLLDPDGIAIDGLGNVWISNNIHSTITEFANNGTLLSPSGFQSAPLYLPGDIAVDGSGNVWVPNVANAAPNFNTTPGLNIVEFVGAGAPTVTPIATAVATGKLGTRP